MQEYNKIRTKALAQLKSEGFNPYPHKFHVSISLEEFIEKYSSISAGETLSDVHVSVSGMFARFEVSDRSR